MNYLEGLRRLTIIISVVAAILTTVFFITAHNSARQDYSRLMNTVKEIKLQKEFLLANNNDFVKKYVAALKKDAFQDLKILTIKESGQSKEYTILWQQKGLPKEDEIDLLLKNKLYLEDTDYEKERARMLLGYLAE